MWPFKFFIKDYEKEHKSSPSLAPNIKVHYSVSPQVVPLTQTELDRLKFLKQERLKDQKRKRIELFMNLPEDLREEVLVAARLCKFAHALCSSSKVSEEEARLEDRRGNSYHNYTDKADTGPNMHLSGKMQVWLNNIDGLTLEDLEHAHAGEAIDKILLTDTDTNDK